MERYSLILVVTALFTVVFLPDQVQPTKSKLGIINGRPADFADVVRSYVRLYRDIEGRPPRFFCGGTLIEHDKVLTAAHCLETANNIIVCTGSTNCLYDPVGDTCIKVNASDSSYIHKDYIEAAKNNEIYGDIAVIQLPERITNPAVKPIPICKRKRCDEGVERYHRLVGRAHGCGLIDLNRTLATSVLEVDYATIDNEDGFLVFSGSIPYKHRYRLIYVRSPTAEEGRTCNGDSGGPLTFYNEVTGGYEVCGVTSFGGVNCTSLVPQGFTSAEDYYSFIVFGQDGVRLDQAQAEISSIPGLKLLANRNEIFSQKYSQPEVSNQINKLNL